MLLAASLFPPSSFLLELVTEMTMVQAKENRDLHFPLLLRNQLAADPLGFTFHSNLIFFALDFSVTSIWGS